MPSTTSYRRGDIVLVSFPFTDLSATKRRPALVISPDSLNHAGQDVILVAITSQPPAHGDAGFMSIQFGDFAESALPKQSFIRLPKIFTIHSSLILKKIGALKPATVDQALHQLRTLFA